jgi:ABC-type sulfate/molybdate transport systems ATPase subunit
MPSPAAVDSHVAHHLLEKCILGALADKTRVLITHHLEVLPHADYILVLEDGAITQQGTFDELRRAGGTFTQLMDEYGTEKAVNEESAESDEKPKEAAKQDGKKEGSGVKVMQDEERNTGSVDWSVYIAYAKAMGANGWLFLAAALLILAQCSQVGNTLFLGFWSGGAIEGFSQGDYMVSSLGKIDGSCKY